MQKLSLTDLDIHSKKVLMRVDFNVPIDKNGVITDDTRILSSLPSIEYVLNKGGILILMSHLGRPKDKSQTELSLASCAERLSQLLKKPVQMGADSVGQKIEAQIQKLQPGQVILLENLRFHRGEEHPEQYPEFAKQLAQLGDLYVNDAFGTAHRKHASTFTVPQLFPNKAAAGFLMEKEIQFLQQIVEAPQHPFCALVGGSKISTKMGVLKSLLKKVDTLMIGGAMSYTFMKAKGLEIGDSLVETEFLQEAQAILKESQSPGAAKLLLPVDHQIAKRIDETADIQIVEDSNGIPLGFKGVDIGPQTIQLYFSKLKDAKTIFWNGPMGIFEIKKFSTGTIAMAKILASSSATTIVGGGDSIAALQVAGVKDKISHVSTGGGASMEFIEFETLPGIEALSNR